MAASESLPIKTTNKNPISRVVLLLTGSCLSPQFLLSIPSLISSPPLQQATHLVSFLLVLSPLPRSKKGANHYNWHHAGQLSRLGEAPFTEVWVNRVDIYIVCYLRSLVKPIQDFLCRLLVRNHENVI